MGRRADAWLLVAGAGLSYVGTAIVPVALSLAVLDGGHGAEGLGMVLAAQTIPTIALLLLGGVAADRWSRRGIMIGADCVRAAAQALLAGDLILGGTSLAPMIAAAAAVGLGDALFRPARGGFVAEIVARERLGRTNAMLLGVNALAMVVGPAIGGFVVALRGPGWGIALDAASYLASAACLVAIRAPAPAARSGPLPRPAVRRELADAFAAVRSVRWLMLLIGQFGLLNMLAIAPFRVIAPTMLSRSATGAGAWGALLTATGIGAVMGTLGCMRWQPRRILLGVEASCVLLVCPLLALAVGAPRAWIVASGLPFGLGAAALSILTMTAIQREVDRSLLSRVMAMVELANSGLIPLGYAIAGPALDLLGAAASLSVSGASIIACTGVLCSRKEIRRFELAS